MNKKTVLYLTVILMVVLSLLSVAYTQTQGNNGNGPDSDIIRHKTKDNKDASVPAGTTSTITPKITYHGGAMIPQPVIYYIWYGNWNQNNGSDTPAGQQILRDFANSIGGSQHFAINTTYSINGYTISGNVTFGGETTVGYPNGTVLSDAAIQQAVYNAINHGVPWDPSGVYFLLTSSDVTASSGFCTQYCGWHTSGSSNFGGRVRYSFIGNASRCITACAAQSTGPNDNAGVDGMVSIITHELEEATTDADPGTNPAWYDARGAENADKCAWTFGQNLFTAGNGAKYNLTLGSGTQQRNYLIQRNLKYANSGSKCFVDMTHQ